MSLRGIKPKEVKSRLRVFIYGAAKIGKTTACIQFPKPYWIDTEGCADKKKYVELITKSNGVVFQTQDFEDIMSEVRMLLITKHDFKTLVIDSFTILYNDLIDKAADKVGTEFGRHYNEANRQVKRLLNLLLRLDMNVIITSHSKNEYGDKLQVLGQTFDCYKKLDYLFDLIMEVQKRGDERVAIVKGTRFEQFKENETFKFSYDEVASRYGREMIERDAIAVKLANESQVADLLKLIDILKVPEDKWEKWLEKGNAEKWEEMSEDSIQKCIDFLRSEIQKAAA